MYLYRPAVRGNQVLKMLLNVFAFTTFSKGIKLAAAYVMAMKLRG